MKFFDRQKKKILSGVILFTVVFGGILLPIQNPITSNPSLTTENSGAFISIAHAQNNPQPPQPPTQPPKENGCEWWEFGCQLTYFFTTTLPSLITNIILTITAWFLGIGGLVLNQVIAFTVVDMSANIKGVTAIEVTWKVMRDLANLGFIFILLYIAIGTILRLGGVDMKKMLVNVILVALLLNFSLFFTKVIIDASNIITIGFYNKISTSTVSGQPGITGLSGAFIDRLGITSLYNPLETNALVTQYGDDPGKILLFGLFGGILCVTAGFIFLAAAVMFIIRYVTLIFLMVLSPLAFAAIALPNDDYSKKWWSKLWDNIIFAPVFMVLTWATLTILGGIMPQFSIRDSLVGAVNSTSGAPATGALNMLMNFAIVIVMMVSTLVVSKELGAAGAGGALKYGAKLRGRAQGVIGRGALRMTPVRTMDKKFAESRFGQTALGSGLRNITTGAAMKAEFGSGKSISKVDKELKKARKDFAKDRSEDIDRDHEKDEEARANLAVQLRSNKFDTRYEAHKELLKKDQQRLESIKLAQESALKRKAYAEAEEINKTKEALSQRVAKMQSKQEKWDTLKASGYLQSKMTPLRENAEKDSQISDDDVANATGNLLIGTKDGKNVYENDKDRLKMLQRITGTNIEIGNKSERLADKTKKVLANKFTGTAAGAGVGLAAAGPLGVIPGAVIGATLGSESGKKFIAKTKKFWYGDKDSARKETIKKLRDDAKKGKKGGGDDLQKIKAILGVEGESGGGDGGEKSGEKKS